MTEPPPPDHRLTLADGRALGYDDRGDPDGAIVLFFHGTPDTRLARHPDDSIVAASGLRLIAVDRPGLGGSDIDPVASPTSVADDHLAVLDHLGAERVHVVAWSAGSIPALALAGRHPDRTQSLTLVAPLIPADAYGSADVLDGADDSRRLFADVHGSMTPDEVGRELAMWLVPPEIDGALAREILADSIGRLDGIPGAGDTMVAALRGSVAAGMTGLEREIAAQATPLGSLLDQISSPVTVHGGTHDVVTPPAMADWIARRLGAELRLHDDGHLLAITRWAEIVSGLGQA
ncbi:alpha/beta fold hydrolase [Actinospongicola halichondriae]|uniref:alpha/beta fold hydrolase n=1 Tax=Actinospongicola halichondriae TaxID=3236844 RepID=UPI003D4EB16F